MVQHQFPSPIGELHFSIKNLKLLNSYFGFPSPIGELHFSIGNGGIVKWVMYSFRPLSGSYISQLSLDVAHATVCRSFRPLSGSYISQSVKVIVLTGSVTVSVPYRGATFLNLLRSYCCEQMQTRFRPLSGSYISQWLPVVSFLPEYGFPSPIGELHFSIINNQTH